MKTPPLRFFRYIEAKGYKTGSSVLGGWTKNSDIDYVLMYDKFLKQYERFFTYLVNPDPDIYPEAHKVAYVQKEGGQVVNLLLFIDKEERDVWIQTTELLLQLKKIHPVFSFICNHKNPRVTLFKLVRENLEIMHETK